MNESPFGPAWQYELLLRLIDYVLGQSEEGGAVIRHDARLFLKAKGLE